MLFPGAWLHGKVKRFLRRYRGVIEFNWPTIGLAETYRVRPLRHDELVVLIWCFYGSGLKGEQIPLEGRITAVADVFDALMSRRVYKKPFSLDETVELMRAGRGSHFDPEVLDVFLGNLDGALAIKAEYPDD